jgi:hypothetical protein
MTSCDPINPYTSSGTFGVPYNGGYKPDPTIEWIPPGDNTVNLDSSAAAITDDVPFFTKPANTLMNTCEGRRADPRVPIKGYEFDYDDFTVSDQNIPPVVAPISVTQMGWCQENSIKLILVLLIIVSILWITRL